MIKVTNMENGYVHAKLADFGLSKIKENSYFTQTFNIGTPKYMAPEVIDFNEPKIEDNGLITINIQKYAFKSDVFSFDMMCCEILTGKEPFLSSRPYEIRRKIKSGECPILLDHCPPILEILIKDC